jgi:hypothetical protein
VDKTTTELVVTPSHSSSRTSASTGLSTNLIVYSGIEIKKSAHEFRHKHVFFLILMLHVLFQQL